jgi:hypothetical protein
MSEFMALVSRLTDITGYYASGNCTTNRIGLVLDKTNIYEIWKIVNAHAFYLVDYDHAHDPSGTTYITVKSGKDGSKELTNENSQGQPLDRQNKSLDPSTQNDIDFLVGAVKSVTNQDVIVEEWSCGIVFEVISSLDLFLVDGINSKVHGIDENALSKAICREIAPRNFVLETLKIWKDGFSKWSFVAGIKKDKNKTVQTHKQHLLDRIASEHDRLRKSTRSPWALMEALGELASMKIMFDDKNSTEEWTEELQKHAIEVAAMALDMALEAGDGGDRGE